MKKIFLILCLLCLAPSWAFGAVIYAIPDTVNANKIRYLADAWPTNSPETGTANTDLEAALTAAGASGTLNIGAGTYSGTMIDSADGLDTTAASQTINATGAVVFDGLGLGDNIFTSWNASTIINGNKQLIFKNAPDGFYCIMGRGTGGTLVVNDVEMTESQYGFRCYYTPLTLNNCEIHGLTKDSASNNMVDGDAGCALAMNNCLVYDNLGWVAITNGTTHYIRNCIFYGHKTRCISASIVASNTIVRNCTFAGNGILGTAYGTVIASSPATIDFDYNIKLPNSNNDAAVTCYSGITDGGHNIEKSPLFIARKRPVKIALVMDDTTNLSDWTQLADAADVYDMKVTLACSSGVMTEGNWTTVAPYIANEHGISSHGNHHAAIGALTGINIAYTNPGYSTDVTIIPDYANRGASGSIILDSGDDGDDITQTFSATQNLSALCSALEVKDAAQQNHYVFSVVTDVNGTRANALSICLDSCSTINIASGAGSNFNLSQTNFFNEEITLSKSDIESNLLINGVSHTCKSFIYPYNYHSQAAMTALYNSGYIGAASGANAFDSVTPTYNFSNQEIYCIRRETAFLSDNIERRVHAFVEYLGYCGGTGVIFDHAFSDFPLVKWQEVMAALSSCGVQTVTLDDLVQYVQDNGVDADADGERWTRDFTAYEAANPIDFRLDCDPLSPCANAGTWITGGPRLDIDGTGFQGDSPDIGAYANDCYIYPTVPGRVTNPDPY